MTNLQAALGLAQIEQIEKFIEIKSENYKKYKDAFHNIQGLELLDVRKGIRSNRWFYALMCKGYCKSRDALIQYLSENKVQSRPIWGLINEQVPYKKERAYKIDKALFYWKYIINIPCSTNLAEEDIWKVARLIIE